MRRHLDPWMSLRWRPLHSRSSRSSSPATNWEYCMVSAGSRTVSMPHLQARLACGQTTEPRHGNTLCKQAVAAWALVHTLLLLLPSGWCAGDIKPANIMCNVKSASHAKSVPTNLRAIDFGCSQFLGPRRLTKRTGTPIFMVSRPIMHSVCTVQGICP